MESQTNLQSEKRRKLTKKKDTQKSTVEVDQGDENEDQLESSEDGAHTWEKNVAITRQTKAERLLRIAEIPAYYPPQSGVQSTAFLIDATGDASVAKLLKDDKTSMNKLALRKV
jgi:hypothetical protein